MQKKYLVHTASKITEYEKIRNLLFLHNLSKILNSAFLGMKLDCLDAEF